MLFVLCTPTAIKRAYTEKEILRSFILGGNLDEESRSAVDLIIVFNTLKRLWKIEDRERWIKDLPHLVKTMLKFGHIPEKVFDELGYPEDCDR